MAARSIIRPAVNAGDRTCMRQIAFGVSRSFPLALCFLLPASLPSRDANPGPERGVSVPQGTKVTLLAKAPEIVHPIAIAFDCRERPWVLEHGSPAAGGGRLRIFMDAVSDSLARDVGTFVSGLNDATGLALGHGGVFLGADSRLLFFADQDSDDIPDGPPSTLVEGFGPASLFERLHSFAWGPDGWLYGCHGGRSVIGGTALEGGVWRWHPVSKVFEVVRPIEAGARGLDFDARFRPRMGSFPPKPEGWEGLALDPGFEWTAAVSSPKGVLFLLDGQIAGGCSKGTQGPCQGRVIRVERSEPRLREGPGRAQARDLWARFVGVGLDAQALSKAMDDPNPAVRVSAVRISGEVDQNLRPPLERWEQLASRETDSDVLKELETFCRKLASLEGAQAVGALRIARAGRLECAETIDLDAILLEGEVRALPALLAHWRQAEDDDRRASVLERLARLPAAPLDCLVLANWASLSPRLKSLGVSCMASREAWALALLGLVEAGRVPAEAISPEDARRLTSLGSDRVRLALERVWGRVSLRASGEMTQRRERLEHSLLGTTGSFERGAEVFEKRCAKCHELYGKGHRVGPRLDDLDRGDISRLLRSIVDPNDEVRREYFSSGVLQRDGQFLQGIVVSRANGQITLRREEGVEMSLAQADILKLVESGVSLMPEGLTNDLTEAELRDLIAYLVSRPALSKALRAGPFRTEGMDAFETALQPELGPGPFQGEPIAWRELDVGSGGQIDSGVLGLWRPSDIVYLNATIEVIEELSPDWIVETNASVKIWIGGGLVYESRSPAVGHGRCVRFRATLSQGRNEVLVKVVQAGWAPGALRLRLEDPRRMALWRGTGG